MGGLAELRQSCGSMPDMTDVTDQSTSWLLSSPTPGPFPLRHTCSDSSIFSGLTPDHTNTGTTTYPFHQTVAQPLPLTSMGGQPAAAAALRPSRAGELRREVRYNEGRWGSDETTLLLAVCHTYICEELRLIGEIAAACGVNRPLRAIDKQLKRTLKFRRWIDRDPTQLRATLGAILAQSPPLTAPHRAQLEAAKQRWSVSLPSGPL